MAITRSERAETFTFEVFVMYRFYFKRLIDIFFASLILIAVFPIFLVTSIVCFIQNRGKIFFVQERPGLMQKPFKVLKFRTMTDERDKNGNLLPDINRITKAGSIIRKLSIDEFPQLINVLKGEMSLVGPRPLLLKYIPLYSATQIRRHEVRPGITGWAQVNGRNSISWTKRFELDVYYVDNLSFALDCKIFWMTIIKVLKREGINQSKLRPMEPFDGRN